MKYCLRLWNRKSGKTLNTTINSDLPMESILKGIRICNFPIQNNKERSNITNLEISVTIKDLNTGSAIRKKIKLH